jgi:nuclear pore complex protein Nup205
VLGVITLTCSDFEDPDALRKFFGLMLSILRILSAVVVCRGSQNNAIASQVRHFLEASQQSIMAVLKRSAKTTGLESDHIENIEELVDNLTLLAHVTGFLEVSLDEQKRNP